MWDLPGPGLEPVSPALADGFLTTAPPEKSLDCLLKLSLESFLIHFTYNAFVRYVIYNCLQSIFSSSQQGLLQNKRFSFWWGPLYQFWLLWIMHLVSSLRTLCLTLGPKIFSLFFSPKSFISLLFTFKSLINFELIFVQCRLRDPFFCLWVSDFSSPIC